MKKIILLICMILITSISVAAVGVTLSCPASVEKGKNLDCTLAFDASQSLMILEATLTAPSQLGDPTITEVPTDCGDCKFKGEYTSSTKKISVNDFDGTTGTAGTTKIAKLSFPTTAEGSNVVISLTIDSSGSSDQNYGAISFTSTSVSSGSIVVTAAAQGCTVGTFKCVGDELQTCAADGTWPKGTNCGSGLCDANKGQCTKVALKICADLSCTADQYCDNSNADKDATCVAKKAKDADCTKAEECISGLCPAGKCTEADGLKGYGAPCTQASECADGGCTSGYCGPPSIKTCAVVTCEAGEYCDDVYQTKPGVCIAKKALTIACSDDKECISNTCDTVCIAATCPAGQTGYPDCIACAVADCEKTECKDTAVCPGTPPAGDQVCDNGFTGTPPACVACTVSDCASPSCSASEICKNQGSDTVTVTAENKQLVQGIVNALDSPTDSTLQKLVKIAGLLRGYFSPAAPK